MRVHSSAHGAERGPSLVTAQPGHLPLGTLIAGRYLTEALLGNGGFGAVYASTDTKGGGRAAVKVVSRAMLDEVGGDARFRREAELASRLSHPHTVRVLDAGNDSRGVLYIAFELLEGSSVEAQLITGGAMTPRRACAIALDVLSALEEAHGLGIVHRDIKPGNVFLVPLRGAASSGVAAATSGEHVKVLDFGIAKSTNAGTHGGALTRDGTQLGTPVYMAPEQIVGEPIGPHTDLYAVGLVLAEMVLGTSPYGEQASWVSIVADRIAGKPVPFPADFAASPLGPLVKRATAATAYRFKTAAEMRQSLLGVFPSLPDVVTIANDDDEPRTALYAPPSPGPLASHLASTAPPGAKTPSSVDSAPLGSMAFRPTEVGPAPVARFVSLPSAGVAVSVLADGPDSMTPTKVRESSPESLVPTRVREPVPESALPTLAREVNAGAALQRLVSTAPAATTRRPHHLAATAQDSDVPVIAPAHRLAATANDYGIPAFSPAPGSSPSASLAAPLVPRARRWGLIILVLALLALGLGAAIGIVLYLRMRAAAPH